MFTKRRIIVGKIESVEGTAEALDATDSGILAIEPKFEVDIKRVERRPAMPTFSKLPSGTGAQAVTLGFKAELKGAGAAYASNVVPAIGKYLRACGFSETIDTTPGAENVIYKPASSGAPSMTLWGYEDGVIKKVFGARGNVKLSGKLGEPLIAEFAFTGVWGGAVDGALITPTYEGTKPPHFLSAGFTIGAYAARIAGIDMDMANVVALRGDANKAEGYFAAAIVDRNSPNGKFDPEMASIATHDFFGLWKAGTPAALNIGPLGAAQYNRFTITAPKANYIKVSDAEREGLAVADTSFELAMNTGDDELSIKFH